VSLLSSSHWMTSTNSPAILSQRPIVRSAGRARRGAGAADGCLPGRGRGRKGAEGHAAAAAGGPPRVRAASRRRARDGSGSPETGAARFVLRYGSGRGLFRTFGAAHTRRTGAKH
jgi:hypothetical protein